MFFDVAEMKIFFVRAGRGRGVQKIFLFLLKI